MNRDTELKNQLLDGKADITAQDEGGWIVLCTHGKVPLDAKTDVNSHGKKLVVLFHIVNMEVMKPLLDAKTRMDGLPCFALWSTYPGIESKQVQPRFIPLIDG